jgi:hypothetical protein
MLSLHHTDRSNCSFIDRSGPATCSLFGMPQRNPGAIGPSHTA